MLAGAQGHTTTVALLISGGARVDLQDKVYAIMDFYRIVLSFTINIPLTE